MAMKAVMVFVIAVAIAAMPRLASAQRGPDVVIIAEEDKMIYEFRQNGELRMIRIVPTFGKPYYLVPADPTKGFGDLQRVDALVPSWVLWEFD
ncbi:MAG: DUF2782 domain-containing protein [Pseudomonadales bacterium]|nr:DUF2782 domain-containing protein [Pseudomonadales bacterium]